MSNSDNNDASMKLYDDVEAVAILAICVALCLGGVFLLYNTNDWDILQPSTGINLNAVAFWVFITLGILSGIFLLLSSWRLVRELVRRRKARRLKNGLTRTPAAYCVMSVAINLLGARNAPRNRDQSGFCLLALLLKMLLLGSIAISAIGLLLVAMSVTENLTHESLPACLVGFAGLICVCILLPGVFSQILEKIDDWTAAHHKGNHS